MRNLLVITFVFILVISCFKEPVINIREGMIFDPDTILVDPSVKGWELYTWQSGDSWKYSLMPGTNRIKSSEEILANPIAVVEREQIKLVLRQLPGGEEISWYGEDWITANIEGVTTIFKTPPLLAQYDIHTFCRRNTLTLTIVP